MLVGETKVRMMHLGEKVVMVTGRDAAQLGEVVGEIERAGEQRHRAGM